MKHFSKLAIVAISLSLISGPTLAGGFKRIRKEADFAAQVVGKAMTNEFGNVVVNADGTMVGAFNNKDLVGVWKWNKGYFCRNARLGGKEMGADCQLVRISGNEVEFVRKKGKGKTSSLTMH